MFQLLSAAAGLLPVRRYVYLRETVGGKCAKTRLMCWDAATIVPAKIETLTQWHLCSCRSWVFKLISSHLSSLILTRPATSSPLNLKVRQDIFLNNLLSECEYNKHRCAFYNLRTLITGFSFTWIQGFILIMMPSCILLWFQLFKFLFLISHNCLKSQCLIQACFYI